MGPGDRDPKGIFDGTVRLKHGRYVREGFRFTSPSLGVPKRHNDRIGGGLIRGVPIPSPRTGPYTAGPPTTSTHLPTLAHIQA
ncbi:hypothetical protein NHX12_032476 [Muraenolepis orangiensis]|uniref:Uncharacterized protein n=1 Tax=Muraenolepis orangiensis TaxID=630683 RepID=A0A9Q0E7W5_9TELE|nr:hypothetical protein NHX12_032476 [Muraenolepis orangiensis]